MLLLGFDYRHLNSSYGNNIENLKSRYLTKLDCMEFVSADRCVMPGPLNDLSIDYTFADFPPEFDVHTYLWTNPVIMRQFYSEYLGKIICFELTEGSDVYERVALSLRTRDASYNIFNSNIGRLINVAQMSSGFNFEIENWKCLGNDVVDPAFLSGLMRVGLGKSAQTARRKLLKNYVNEYHLIKNNEVAIKFANWLSDKIPEHAPFFSLSIYIYNCIAESNPTGDQFTPPQVLRRC